MTENWINFYNKNTGEKLGGYTVEGAFPDELDAAMGLIAYDNNIDVSDIEVKQETNKRITRIM